MVAWRLSPSGKPFFERRGFESVDPARSPPGPRSPPRRPQSAGGSSIDFEWVSVYDRLAELPIEIESYELEDRDREYGDFTRPSTIVHLRGGGQEGVGEDVVYDVLDHIAHRDAGPVLDLTGPGTLGELCELLGELDLFPGAPPDARALAPLPPLGVRVGRAGPRAAPGRAPAARGGGARPEAADLRLLDPAGRDRRGRAAVDDRAGPQAARQVPDAALQARPRERLGRRADRGAEADRGRSTCSTSRACTRARRSTSTPTRSCTGGSPTHSRTPTSRTPTSTRRRRRCWSRTPTAITWDAPLHSLADVVERNSKAINSKPSRFGSLRELIVRLRALRARGDRDLRRRAGRDQGPAAGRSSTWPRCSTPTPPTMSPPPATTIPRSPTGFPRARWTRCRSQTGFRWGEESG